MFIWHLDNAFVWDCFQDYDFQIMDIFTLFLLLLHHMGWRLFYLISSQGMVFSWRTVSADFQANCLGDCGNSLSLCLQGIVAWRNWVEKLVFWTVLIYFIYSFIHLWFIYLLFIIYKFTFRELFIRSFINSVGGEGGREGSNFIKLCKDSSGPFCSLVRLLQDVITSLLSFLIHSYHCL